MTANPTMVLKQDGEKVTGEYVSAQYGKFPMTGTVKGTDVVMSFQMNLEGTVMKRWDAPYRSGEHDSWRKIKCKKSDSFPIIAFVEKLGARPRRIASLYLGRYEHGKLLYAGKAQTGFKNEDLYELRERLDPYRAAGEDHGLDVHVAGSA